MIALFQHVLQFGLQQPGMDGIEGIGELEEHDADSDVGSIQGRVGFLQQVDHCIVDHNFVQIELTTS